MLVHYHRGDERAAAVAAEIGGAPIGAGGPDGRSRRRPAVRDGARGSRLGRRLRGGRGRLARRGPAGLGAPARALGGDDAPEPDRHLPHRARVPARGRPHGPRLARARRLDRRALRRGRACRLRGGEVGAPGRAAAVAEERGHAGRAARPGQRRRSRLDRVADDPRPRRRGGGAPHLADDGAARRWAGPRMSRPRSSCSPPTSSRATSAASSSRSPAGWKAASSTTTPDRA